MYGVARSGGGDDEAWMVGGERRALRVCPLSAYVDVPALDVPCVGVDRYISLGWPGTRPISISV